MAYDRLLAEQLRAALAQESGATEKHVFGGVAFMINGHLAVAASGRGGLLLRVDPADTEELVQEENASRFVMRGRPMEGWLHVDLTAATTDAELVRWVALGVARSKALPPK